MRSRLLIPVVVAAAALSIAAAPARAQSAASAAPAVPSHWDAHPTGKYTLSVTTPEGQMSAMLTLTDSAGKTTATIWPEGDQEAHVMAVANKDSALVLTTDTPAGMMEVVLEKRGDKLTGHWSRGGEGGAIEGAPAKG